MSFWQIMGLFLVAGLAVAYVLVVAFILRHLFTVAVMPGWIKALWVLCLILIPLITALVYVVLQSGDGVGPRPA